MICTYKISFDAGTGISVNHIHPLDIQHFGCWCDEFVPATRGTDGCMLIWDSSTTVSVYVIYYSFVRSLILFACAWIWIDHNKSYVIWRRNINQFAHKEVNTFKWAIDNDISNRDIKWLPWNFNRTTRQLMLAHKDMSVRLKNQTPSSSELADIPH